MTGASPLTGRSVFVTGAYGLLGSWLVKALLQRGARTTVLRRDAVAVSALALEGTEARVNVVVGDVCDAAVMERALGEYEVDTVFHLAAQTIVGVANRSPVSTFEANIRGTWTLLEACRRSRVSRVVVAASDKAYGAHDELPYTEELALQPVYPVRRLQGCDRHDRPLLLAHVRAAGGGDPVREHLWRRRPQPVAPGARVRAGGDRWAGARDPLRWHARARLPVRRGRRGGVPGDLGAAGDRPRSRRGLQRRGRPAPFRARGGRAGVSRRRHRRRAGRARNRNPARARSRVSGSTRRSCGRCRAGSRGRRWRRGFSALSTGTAVTWRLRTEPTGTHGLRQRATARPARAPQPVAGWAWT